MSWVPVCLMTFAACYLWSVLADLFGITHHHKSKKQGILEKSWDSNAGWKNITLNMDTDMSVIWSLWGCGLIKGLDTEPFSSSKLKILHILSKTQRFSWAALRLYNLFYFLFIHFNVYISHCISYSSRISVVFFFTRLLSVLNVLYFRTAFSSSVSFIKGWICRIFIKSYIFF